MPDNFNDIFKSELQNMITELIDSGSIRQAIKDNIEKQITDAIEESFRYGDIRNKIKDKIKATMLPMIESYDLSEYIPKLDIILTELVNTPEVRTNHKILNNFKEEMTAPQGIININDIFDRYCRFVAEEMSCVGRNVDEDNYDSDGPFYTPVDCMITSEKIVPEYSRSSTERYSIIFRTEDPDECEDIEDMTFEIQLLRYSFDPEDTFRITILLEDQNLRSISTFEAYLVGIMSAGTKIKADPKTLSNGSSRSVTPEERPTATYS